MKYLKAKKKVDIYNRKGEAVDSISVELRIIQENRILNHSLLQVHFEYTEIYTDGSKVIQSVNSPKNIPFSLADALSEQIKPSLPSGLSDMDERNLKVLTAAKSFFIGEYKGLTMADLEIVEDATA